MSDATRDQGNSSVIERRAPSWLVSSGIRAWLLIGIVAFAIAVYFAISLAGQLVVPAVIAGTIGVLFAPTVAWLAAHRVPKLLAALIVIVGLTLVVVFTLSITVTSVIDQAPEIEAQLREGVEELGRTLEKAGVNVDTVKAASEAADAPDELAGLAKGSVGAIFSSIGAFLFGAFIMIFLLFYALTDWPAFERWLGSRLGVPADVGGRIVGDAVHDVRLYFGGLTVASIIVAAIIGATMWGLGVPLAFTVVIVTFVTAYIPYVGAIVSGAFAFLVTLGAEGFATALIVLGVVLVAQNVVQAVLQARLTSTGLEVHPAMNFASTILGAIVAGALGAILAAPITATLFKAQRVLEQYFNERD